MGIEKWTNISDFDVDMSKTVHELKTLPKYFEAVKYGDKTFEVRKDDRDYKVGDLLHLKEWDKEYTGSEITRKITYVLGRNEDEKTYVPEGYVILGIQ